MRAHLVLSLALVGALALSSRADNACSSFTTVFNLTDPGSAPALKELSVHSTLWLNATEKIVYVSASFLKVDLPDNSNYIVTVEGPMANYSVPGGVGANFSVQLPSDTGTGNVSVTVDFNFTAGQGPSVFGIYSKVLNVSYVNWVPAADGTCGLLYNEDGFGISNRHMNMSLCQCCDHDISTCATVADTGVATNNTDGGQTSGGQSGGYGGQTGGRGGKVVGDNTSNAAHVASFVGSLLSLYVAVLLFPQLN